ncbi:MAG: PAS domain-containing protein [Bacteroidetes bacterium]|nr:PAS domain-containing protein [Bacteroidota bacterium]
MEANTKMLKTILDEIESGFVILKIVFERKNMPADFTILEVNVPFEEITGISLHDYIGLNYSSVKQDLDFLGFDWLEEFISLSAEKKFRNRENLGEGDPIHLRIRTFIPQPGYLAILVSDVASGRKLERGTGMEDQRFRSLLENFNDGFLFFSTDERITSVSSNIPEMTGYTEDELKLSNELSFLLTEDKHKMKEAIHHVLIQPRLASELEFQVTRKDGTRLWFEGTFHNMLQAKGVNSIVLKIKEITRRKKEEFEFYQITSQLLSNYPI